MELQVLFMFLISVLLALVSAWSFGIMLRLKIANSKYNNDMEFESACQVSNNFVNKSHVIGSFILLLSLKIVVFTGWRLYKSF